MAGGLERIVCPRCRSNNLPGHDGCWSCGAPLPPPEAAASPPGRDWAPSSAGTHSHRAIVLAAAIVMVALLVIAVQLARRSARADGASMERARLEALRDRLLREKSGAGAAAPDPEVSPEEAQARRELQRLRRQLDQSMPGSGMGDVRLRTGDSVPADEYERLQRRARELR